MTAIDLAALETALDALPKAFPGPGGLVGVMKDGKTVAARAWGYADLDAGTPLTTATRMPICSISKQFTCGVLLAALGEPERYDARVAEFLPKYQGRLPTLRQLCDNQSGLRDYWALTVLQGGLAEQTFAREDALPLLARMKTGHFAPGSEYSYCNCNYRIVSEIIESETGKALPDLYRAHIWEPAGMTTAVLTSDTRQPEDGVIGYEGSDATGFFPADNGIFWIGDAGISASLDDMLAYEAWIDATRDDPQSLYRRLAEPPRFIDGAPAEYGYGLAHEEIGGVAFTGHAGALRGFRAHRLNARSERLSVVVLFNHEADAHGAAVQVARAAMRAPAPEPAFITEEWDGLWLDEARGLTATLTTGRREVQLGYAVGPQPLVAGRDGTLTAPGVTVARDGDGLTMARPGENTTRKLGPLTPLETADGLEIAGRYRSDELEAGMEIEARDGGIYARFTGLLGTGRFERMAPLAQDVWRLATRRAMDAPAPGDWTLIVTRAADGTVNGARLGCWLARQIPYEKTA
ncbi:D-aminopeptidase [Salipiger bermudensis]|uniref:D-aminopeptidase n=1 Tax=Salipiger bermudensis TaxID=344736 RepID=UPI001C99DA06|nr:D-aminopeptidase [Salipiger bermudensis]MBY6004992.1 D-aminopeptidase [Salipiger bermudensis]